MNFKIKAGLQKLFSALPYGERINYVFQRFVTRGLPLTEEKFIKKVNDTSLTHYRNFIEFNRIVAGGNVPPRYYEFGAGWDLITPVTFSLLGFEVTCIDIRKLVIPSLIQQTLERFNRLAGTLSFTYPAIADADTGMPILEQLAKRLNVHYRAPMDAAKTDFPDNHFDCMSSTDVLEHIPPADIPPILEECFRILKPGGVLSMIIDYRDHYMYFDANVSPYDFLQYSAQQWQSYNCSLHYQNRLRHSDYLRAIQQSGFVVMKEQRAAPNADGLAKLERLTLDSSFQHYDRDDLRILGSLLVLVKPLN